jgi:hypothetical protein
MDANLSRDSAVKLDDFAAQQAIEMLFYSARSPRCQTRLNTVVAWGVLASAAEKTIRKEKAVEGMVDTAIHPLDSPADQKTVMLATVDELDRLSDELKQHALDLAISKARFGSVNASNAASLALLIAQKFSIFQGLKAYRRLWGVRVSTIGRTLVDCIGPVGGVAVAAAVLVAYALPRIASWSKFPPYAWTIGLSTLLVVSIATGLASAGTALPSRFLTSKLQRIMEALIHGTTVAVVGWIGTLIAGGVMIAALRPIDMSMAMEDTSGLAPAVYEFVVMAAGLAAARLVRFSLQPIGHLPRDMSYGIGAGGGFGIVAMVLTVAVMELSGFSHHSQEANTWYIRLTVVLAAAAGTAWLDAREAARFDRDLDKKTKESRETKSQTIAYAGTASAVALILVLVLVLRRDESRIVNAWSELQALAQMPLQFECPRLGAPTRTQDRLQEGALYPIKACAEGPVNLSVIASSPEAVLRPEDSDEDELPWVLITPSFLPAMRGRVEETTLRAGTNRDYYLCVKGKGRCPVREIAKVDFLTAAILRATGKTTLESLFPPRGLELSPPRNEAEYTITFRQPNYAFL